MGVWGVGPFDHDGAGDFFAALLKPITKLNEVWKDIPASELSEHRRERQKNALRRAKAAKRGRRIGKWRRWISSNAAAQDLYCEARTNAALLFLSHGTDILGGPSLKPVLEALQHIRADKDWLDGWKSPRRIRAALDKEIRAVAKKVKSCCEPNEQRRRLRQPSFGKTPSRFRSKGVRIRHLKRKRRLP